MNANSESSALAVTDVACHRVRVKSWAEAVNLYNELYRNGNIVRVRT